MRPYYEHAGITIFHGDCREILPTLGPFDLCLADPPYGIGYVHGGNNKKQKYQSIHAGVAIEGDDQPFDPSLVLQFQDVILWGANHFADKLPPSGQWLVWDKRCGVVPIRDQSDCELAWCKNGKTARVFRHVWDGFLRDSEMDTQRVHPTQKPVALMTWCLSMFPKAKTVLDPYMGSGTTLVAAKNAGLRATGIEINERYCEIAAKRLSQEVMTFD
jgi:DNA modification methylase